MHIREDDLTGMAIASFLQDHLDEMYEITPPESVHALDLDALKVPEITFWSAWTENELVGSGALKELDTHTGEIKSMRTAKAHRGKGVGSTMLEHIIQEAERRAYQRLYLETGAMPEFAPARALYTRYGFVFRSPFADYTNDPNSVFMTKKL
ncbi:MAG: GNAT family N-acetyltransferase [Cyanobacteria bacterium P01_A01_bin.3]